MNNKIQKKLDELVSLNETIKSAANMIGFDVDGETEKAKKDLDLRVVVNMHQKSMMVAYKSLLDK